ncbi:MAG: hypothetical protein HQL44_10615 [Alphaproteobacteria bacterium]|nr:hypothetical protein [Alphaproteobacteria bacterium]
MRAIAPFFFLALLAVLPSCTYYTLVPASSAVTIADAYRVEVDAPWNSRTVGNSILWTQHGQNLDSLLFFKPAGDGEPAAAAPSQHGKAMPRYKKGMSFVEFPELMRTSLANFGYSDIQISRTEPSTLGGARALRLDFTMRTNNSPLLKGFAVMGVKEEKLYSVMFMAEETTYYPLVAPSAEKVVARTTLQP